MMEYIDTTTLDKVGQFLKDNQLKVFIGESMTGGFLGSVLSMQTDSGSYFLGGVTSYATSVKKSLLQVDDHSISYLLQSHRKSRLKCWRGLKN
ncbi:CinA family protein [Sphingobacterium sp. IITKGP-BTPF85]|uniref:CinA family protein n=1 Tax=Sphingobacterium sp. IITKGP-BTPF85 TaxID=1338009 RepID=UPI0004CE6FF5|nr:CinA family protein [Sphingobacterium sp. IITKGP-BTPF85]KKX46836.1 hypothetical protein L950_0229755 [Sphingobacterium sp. IITKGP-BTPF85]